MIWFHFSLVLPIRERMASMSYMLHVGIRGNMIYLTKLFNSFKKQKIKEAQIKANKSINTANITVTPIHTAAFEDASILDTSTSDIVPLADHPSKKKVIPASDQRTHIEQCIRMWWNNVLETHNLVSQNLLEPDDYNLVLTNDSGSIICSCGTSIVLRGPDGRTHYQLSNHYQHILRNERCNVMKRKQKDQRENNDMNDSHSNEPRRQPSFSNQQNDKILRFQFNTNQRRHELDSKVKFRIFSHWLNDGLERFYSLLSHAS